MLKYFLEALCGQEEPLLAFKGGKYVSVAPVPDAMGKETASQEGKQLEDQVPVGRAHAVGAIAPAGPGLACALPLFIAGGGGERERGSTQCLLSVLCSCAPSCQSHPRAFLSHSLVTTMSSRCALQIQFGGGGIALITCSSGAAGRGWRRRSGGDVRVQAQDRVYSSGAGAWEEQC